MRLGKFVFYSTALFVLSSMSAFAAPQNHVVQVGPGGTLTFSPSSLPIFAGDTVTFTSTANFLHNVDSTGGPTPFKCSVNCTTTNTPAAGPWSATVTFPTTGTVTYQCDMHVGSGMTGTITVQPVMPVKLQSFDVN